MKNTPLQGLGGKGENMLFMSIYTYGHKERDAVVKRRFELSGLGEGVKLIGEWSSLAGGRVFRLVESDDPMAMFGAAYAWTDLGNLEVFPVAETDAILKAIGGGS